MINEAISDVFFMLGMAEDMNLGESVRIRIRAQFWGL